MLINKIIGHKTCRKISLTELKLIKIFFCFEKKTGLRGLDGKSGLKGEPGNPGHPGATGLQGPPGKRNMN